ncbi:class A beta-lactamase-related serine hydrolase [Candidatus Saccharibacteria bacterium]|nr:class A beta-lactamase-related serine hydrolase [Candidatus Saccharibacteria bacterium]
MNRYSSYKPSDKSGRKRTFLSLKFLAAGTVALFLGVHFFASGDIKLANLPIVNHKASATAIDTVVLSQYQQDAMAETINSAISVAEGMRVGVAIEDLNDGHVYSYGVTKPLVAASVGKLITAVDFLHQTESGRYSLDDSLKNGVAGQELKQLIVLSDNQAWDDFNTLLTHNGLSGYVSQIGLGNYDSHVNSLTASEVAAFLGKIYRGQLLNKDNTRLLLSYMKDADYSTYIPASVPEGITVYHKAGWLPERVNDAAIIEAGNHPYTLVIFSEAKDGSYNARSGHKLFASVTEATLKAFAQ